MSSSSFAKSTIACSSLFLISGVVNAIVDIPCCCANAVKAANV